MFVIAKIKLILMQMPNINNLAIKITFHLYKTKIKEIKNKWRD